eukprot:TRINITY_DN5376_c0_g2_i1.p1 TRINITY_DN5376_c0_g2~~TRINITY_DN5376_c0_g2_i1.p1  ORF type:complete len:390 (+),score=124.15 TRINITY_DN5376_c0_g2_i1:238-1407(+)
MNAVSFGPSPSRNQTQTPSGNQSAVERDGGWVVIDDDAVVAQEGEATGSVMEQPEHFPSLAAQHSGKTVAKAAKQAAAREETARKMEERRKIEAERRRARLTAEKAKRVAKEMEEAAEEKCKGDRLARLKDAFGVRSAGEASGAFTPEPMVFEPEILELALEHAGLVRDLERQFTLLVSDSGRSKLVLPPANRDKRAVMHAVAKSFGLESEAYDQEPQRHVEVMKAAFGQVHLPPRPLSEAASSPHAVQNAIDQLMQRNALLLSEVNRATVDLGKELRNWNGYYQVGWLNQSTAVASFDTEQLMLAALDALGGGKRGSFYCRLARRPDRDVVPAEDVGSEDGQSLGEPGWKTDGLVGGNEGARAEVAEVVEQQQPGDANMWAALADDNQ